MCEGGKALLLSVAMSLSLVILGDSSSTHIVLCVKGIRGREGVYV